MAARRPSQLADLVGRERLAIRDDGQGVDGRLGKPGLANAAVELVPQGIKRPAQRHAVARPLVDHFVRAAIGGVLGVELFDHADHVARRHPPHQPGRPARLEGLVVHAADKQHRLEHRRRRHAHRVVGRQSILSGPSIHWQGQPFEEFGLLTAELPGSGVLGAGLFRPGGRQLPAEGLGVGLGQHVERNTLLIGGFRRLESIDHDGTISPLLGRGKAGWGKGRPSGAASPAGSRAALRSCGGPGACRAFACRGTARAAPWPDPR